MSLRATVVLALLVGAAGLTSNSSRSSGLRRNLLALSGLRSQAQTAAVQSERHRHPEAQANDVLAGTPELEGPMPLKAAEQGFQGKDVKHIDQETHTADWMKEYAYGHHAAKIHAEAWEKHVERHGCPDLNCPPGSHAVNPDGTPYTGADGAGAQGGAGAHGAHGAHGGAAGAGASGAKGECAGGSGCGGPAAQPHQQGAARHTATAGFSSLVLAIVFFRASI